MQHRISAARILASKALFETLLSPGFYMALCLGMLCGFFLCTGFVACIGSSGFNPELNPVYQLITSILAGAFGETLTAKLFAEGPFLLALVLAFLPLLFYLAISTVFKFGLEKNSGALELIVYGPADGTSCFLGALVKNIILTIVYLLILLVYFAITAFLYNMVLSPLFFYALLLLFFMALAVYGYSTLVSVVSGNAAAGVVLFLVIFVFFFLLQVGSYALVSGYVKNLSEIFARLLQWFSPVYYWSQGLDMVDYGRISLFGLNLLYLSLLSCGLLLLSHLSLRVKGVRG